MHGPKIILVVKTSTERELSAAVPPPCHTLWEGAELKKEPWGLGLLPCPALPHLLGGPLLRTCPKELN